MNPALCRVLKVAGGTDAVLACRDSRSITSSLTEGDSFQTKCSLSGHLGEAFPYYGSNCREKRRKTMSVVDIMPSYLFTLLERLWEFYSSLVGFPFPFMEMASIPVQGSLPLTPHAL